MTQYQYVGSVTAFALIEGDVAVTLVPNQMISLNQSNVYVARLVERGHLVPFVNSDTVEVGTFTADNGSGEDQWHYGIFVGNTTGQLRLSYKINNGVTQDIAFERNTYIGQPNDTDFYWLLQENATEILDDLNGQLAANNIAFERTFVDTLGQESFVLSLTRTNDSVSSVQFVAATLGANDLDAAEILGITDQTFTFS